MRLLGATIHGFGCFSEKTFSFEDGLNVFLAENGAGKTTLSAFLRVMFYGFRNETKRTEGKRERDQKRPWKGASYGGTVDFEYRGRSYRIERTFGKKAQSDTLKVYDLGSMTATDAFGAEPGLKVFGVDADTFERTAFLAEAPLGTRLTDGVHAKLGNLMDDVTDVGQYDDADTLLKDTENRLGTRSTGESAAVADRITALQATIRNREALERNLEAASRETRQRNEEENRIALERTAVLQKQAELSKYLDSAAKRDKLQSLRAEADERKDAYASLIACFPFGVPEDDRIAEAEKRLAAAEHEKERLSEAQLSDTEDARYRELVLTFRDRKIFDHEEELMTGHSEKAQALSADLRVRYERNQETEKTLNSLTKNLKNVRQTGRIVLLASVASAAVLLVLGIILKSNIFAILAPVVLLLGAFGFLFKKRSEKKLQKAVDEAASEKNRLTAELDRMTREKQASTDVLQSFFDRFGLPYHLDTGTMDLARIFRGYREFERLTEKKALYAERLETVDEALRQVRSFLLDYVPAPSENAQEELKALRTRVFRYRSAETEFLRAKQALSAFEAEVDPESIALIPKPDGTETMETLTDQLNRYDAELEAVKASKAASMQAEERLNEQLDALSDADSELERLYEKRAVLAKRLEILHLTREALREAKQALAEKVTDPVTKRFRDYVGDILPAAGIRVGISAEGDAVFEEQGTIREVNLMSQGYRTLTYFAMRLALLDHMYENDAPPLFLDDPFQSLDGEKLKTALALLEKASKRYQIFYFTCHESRA